MPQKLSLPKIKHVFVSPKHSLLMRNKLGTLVNSASSRKTALMRFKTPMARGLRNGGNYNTIAKQSNADLQNLDQGAAGSLTDLSISQILAQGGPPAEHKSTHDGTLLK